MAVATVIARPGKITSDSVVITMHAVDQETHTLTNSVTDHPVEEGFNVSDHSRPDPDQLNWSCIISNTPISEQQANQAVRAGGFTFQTSQFAAGAIGSMDGFAQGEWQKLRALRESGAIVKVSTTLGDYDSMAITSISLPRTSKNYDAVQFTITFKRIRVVQTKFSRNVTGPPQVQKKKSAGAKTTKDTDNQDSELFKEADNNKESGNNTIKKLANYALSGGK